MPNFDTQRLQQQKPTLASTLLCQEQEPQATVCTYSSKPECWISGKTSPGPINLPSNYHTSHTRRKNSNISVYVPLMVYHEALCRTCAQLYDGQLQHHNNQAVWLWKMCRFCWRLDFSLHCCQHCRVEISKWFIQLENWFHGHVQLAFVF